MKRVHQNRTIIPEYLQPIPVLKLFVCRKYKLKSLVQLCCTIIENSDIDRGTYTKQSKWDELEQVLVNSKQVEADSFRVLCNIMHPVSASAYLREMAQCWNVSVYELLKSLRIIMYETTQDENLDHWDKIPASRPRYPCVMIGKAKVSTKSGLIKIK